MPTTLIDRSPFGELDGKTVERFTLENESGLFVALINYGAAIQELWFQDSAGTRNNLVLGFKTFAEYRGKNPHFGSVLGRYANRIRDARFPLDGEIIHVTANRPPISAHGGARPFDKYVWDAEVVETGDGTGVRFSHVSPDGDEGYPGTFQVSVTYTLTAENGLKLAYEATTDKPTIHNLTNHCYFNLRGEENGVVDDQVLQVFASAFAEADPDQLMTGNLISLDGNSLDFRQPKRIAEVMRDASNPQVALARGIDQCFLLDRDDPSDASLILAARLEDPGSGRVMEVLTTEPGVQIYSSNSLDGSVAGFSGRLYRQSDAICFETQHLPDSANHPNFPSTVLRPGETYAST
ncbi:MAG TPA: aldose epimerase family protein, partial [Thermomicrobiales bacterium]|nr:aldose epimerase family protein [Thermomicrobiales bacterium]